VDEELVVAKILYMSCHSILEYEEVSLLHELGHEVFSPGAYVEPSNPGDSTLRPSIPGLVYDPELLKKFHAIGQKFPGKDAKGHLSQEVVDWADIIIVMHIPRWISLNWPIMKHKRVIWRTIGQSISSTEKFLAPYRKEGLEVIRYSPMEHNIPSYIGGDALIRFYKDPDQYKDWNGNKKRVISFSQNMKDRDRACNFTFFEEVTRPFNRRLFGSGSEELGWGGGKVPYEQLKQELRDNRVYFYTGTHPASYTLNFMEALMTGIPVIALGPKHGNADYFADHNLYEIPNLIMNGINGYISDDLNELRNHISNLFNDHELARLIGAAGRDAAIHHFSKDMIKASWRKFLND